MDFFDRVTKTIASTGQDAIQKTRVFTDTAKLNALCNEEENRISNYYRKIGELYASLHADSSEPEFKELIEAIHQSKQKIQDWNQQIHNIKGTQNCPNCGATIQRGSFFCTACGMKMPVFEQKQDNVLFCSKCGEKLDIGVRFCTSCGTPVEKSPTNRVSVNQVNEETPVDSGKDIGINHESGNLSDEHSNTTKETPLSGETKKDNTFVDDPFESEGGTI